MALRMTSTTPTSPPPTPPPPRVTMLGAIAGDIIGSVYESIPIKRADFEPLVDPIAWFTDDTVLTVATASAILSSSSPTRDYASAYRTYGRKYYDAGYGSSFLAWLGRQDGEPYNSWGNGAAMRVSPVGWAFDTREQVLQEAEKCASVTHNHPEGIKGAQAVALAIYLARSNGQNDNDDNDKESIRRDLAETFGYDLDRTIRVIRPMYTFDVSCQGSVPEAIIAFLESESVEEAIRLAVSLGGDADTQACIAGSIAEAYYGPIEPALEAEVRKRLPSDLLNVVDLFVDRFIAK